MSAEPEGIKLRILAPCEDCIHDRLCSIKGLLGMVQFATLTMPSMLPDLTPRFTETLMVDCAEFIDIINVKPLEKRSTRSKYIKPLSSLKAPATPRRSPQRLEWPSDDELTAYYATHTVRETADHFKISPMTVSRRLQDARRIDPAAESLSTVPTIERAPGHGRRIEPADDELVAFYETHTGGATAEHFGISRATVSRRIAEIQAAGGTVVRESRKRPRTLVDDWSPLCMPAADFAEWQAFNARTAGGRAARPCEDCPVEYAAEMRAKGQCNGEPGVAA